MGRSSWPSTRRPTAHRPKSSASCAAAPRSRAGSGRSSRSCWLQCFTCSTNPARAMRSGSASCGSWHLQRCWRAAFALPRPWASWPRARTASLGPRGTKAEDFGRWQLRGAPRPPRTDPGPPLPPDRLSAQRAGAGPAWLKADSGMEDAPPEPLSAMGTGINAPTSMVAIHQLQGLPARGGCTHLPLGIERAAIRMGARGREWLDPPSSERAVC
mmetsp:Transcript_88651/g.246158  ORF Transcript_88651/g.246158 Transcript_88651/m.246158 type:complete len:214 (-) Transcript_88651:51-692(-)